MFATNGHSADEHSCMVAAASLPPFLDPTTPYSLENANLNIPSQPQPISRVSAKLGSKRQESRQLDRLAQQFEREAAEEA